MNNTKGNMEDILASMRKCSEVTTYKLSKEELDKYLKNMKTNSIQRRK